MRSSWSRGSHNRSNRREAFVSPATTGGPLSPPSITWSNESNLSPPLLFSSPWQDTQAIVSPGAGVGVSGNHRETRATEGETPLTEAAAASRRRSSAGTGRPWAVAATSTGDELNEDVLTDYEQNRRDLEIDAAAGDEVLQALLSWVKQLTGPWRGTPTDFYEGVSAAVSPAMRRGLPSGPASFTARLRRAEAHIAAAGIELDLRASEGRGNHKRRIVTVVPPPADDGDDGDDAPDDWMESDDDRPW